jgi:hypothetical protein
MTYAQTRLTPLEESKALIDAGIDPNIETWNDETLALASEVLDRAQLTKVERLTMPRNS